MFVECEYGLSVTAEPERFPLRRRNIPTRRGRDEFHDLDGIGAMVQGEPLRR
jgi:hypothetical protein